MTFTPLSASAGWQNIMVYAIVACCVIYAILHATRFFKKKGGGCGSCPSCPCNGSTHALHPHDRSKQRGCNCHAKEKRKKNCCG